MNTNNGGNMAYIRQCENEPLGFIQFTFITLEGWFFKERLGFIREFWVAEKFRKQGHGTEMLSLAEKYFKDSGIRRIVLTAEENEQQFYLNRGYTICECISAKNNKELCESVKLYCKEKWNNVYKPFSENAELSINSDKLPKTYVIKGMEQEKEIIGFYQLIENDNLTYHTKLSPFVATLYVDERVRGNGFGELMLTHAKYEAARLGYDKLYISTDHIGYYEKYGFREIGLDIYTWGSPTKIYEAYTP